MSQQLLIVVALALAGYLLLLVEIFVIPGFGVAGILGLLGLAAASVSAVFFFGGFVGGLVVAGVVGLTSLILWVAPRTRAGRGLIHRDSLAHAHAAESDVIIGDRGVAESDLRPAGVARIGERRVSVVTEGDYIGSGTRVEIVDIEGGRVVVTAVEDGGS